MAVRCLFKLSAGAFLTALLYNIIGDDAMKPFKLASWEQKGKYTHIKIDAAEPLLIGDG